MQNFVKQVSTATSGTVTMPDTKQDVVLIHDAESLAETLTMAFPANPVDGQRVVIASTLGVTELTLSSALTIVGGLSVIAAGGCAGYIYEAGQNKWFKIS